MNVSLQKNIEQITKFSEIFFGAKKLSREDAQRKELLDNLEKTNNEIKEAMARFNNATDQCLIDMYAYEIKSLEQKYSFYLSRIKQMDSKRA